METAEVSGLFRGERQSVVEKMGHLPIFP